MASPVVQARTESAVTTAGTSHTVSRPAGVSGRLVIILFGYVVTGQTITWASGYTAITGFKNEQTGRCMDAAYHWDDGTEGTSITVTTSASTKSCHHAYSISGAENPATQAPQIGTAATGTSANPDPPTVTPSGGTKDYLFIALFIQAGEEADDDTWTTAYPTGYGNLVQKTTGTAGAASTNASIAAANRQATVSSENPSTFTTAQSLAWTAQTIAIYPSTVVYEELAGVIAGETIVSGALTRKRGLGGVIAGLAAVSGALGAKRGLGGLSQGVCSISGALVATRGLSGVSNGESVVSGSLSRELALAGLSEGVATVLGSLSIEGQAEATGRTILVA